MTNNTNAQVPSGTLTLAQIDAYSLDIADFFKRSTTKTPSPDQIRTAIERYCDDPAINATDRARIRVRVEQHFA